MKALIDADIFQYEFGNATNDEGVPLSWPFVQARVQGRIDNILEKSGADEYQLYITSDDKSNFRFKVATILPYKGNRTEVEKPRYYNHIRNFLKDHRGAIEVHGMEADDAISIAQWQEYKRAEELLGSCDDSLKWECETIICSRDKDLNMVPGWHYSWLCGKQLEKEPWWQNEFEGLKCFYSQLLTGDYSVDNILGLYRVGKLSSLVRAINGAGSVFDMYKLTYKAYFSRFGNYAEQFLTENARLLWMLQEEGQVWNPPFEKYELEEA